MNDNMHCNILVLILSKLSKIRNQLASKFFDVFVNVKRFT